MVVTWLSTHGLDNAPRSTIARAGFNRGVLGQLYDDVRKPLTFSPWNGSFLFWFRKHLLSYRTELKDAGFHKEEEISITCAGRSSRIVKEFIRDCRDEYLRQVSNKTTIFENRGDHWKKLATRTIRPLSTVIISEKQKQQLIADLKEFLDPETRTWFAKRTIPYRKGYLFHGPPGTRKSSFSLSMAGELDVDIYIVSMPGLDDGTLKDLFADLPQRCVVLLEDIDAVGMERSPVSDDSGDESTKSKKGVTMSGLLNTLDGVASQEGRVLVMTTNHIEKLDEALIRPGRVDKKVEFQYADCAMTSQLFDFVFQQDTEDDRPDGTGLRDLRAMFVAKVPELEFSSAEILSHLLQYRQSPTAAVEHVGEWIATMQCEKIGAYSQHGGIPPCRAHIDDDRDNETRSDPGFSNTPLSSSVQGPIGNISGSSKPGALALSAIGELRHKLTLLQPRDPRPNPEVSSSVSSASDHGYACCMIDACREDSLSSRDDLDEPLSPRPLLARSPEPAISSARKKTCGVAPEPLAQHRKRNPMYTLRMSSRPNSPSKLAWWPSNDKPQPDDKTMAHEIEANVRVKVSVASVLPLVSKMSKQLM